MTGQEHFPYELSRGLVFLPAAIILSAVVLAELARKAEAPVCVGGSIEAVAACVEALAAKDVKDVMISPGDVPVAEALAFLTLTRRAALNKTFRPLGCPALARACGEDKADASQKSTSEQLASREKSVKGEIDTLIKDNEKYELINHMGKGD